MVHGVRLEVVVVREACALRVTEPQGPVGETIMDAVTVLALMEFKQVVFNYGRLAHSCVLGTGGIAGNAVTESKDVLMLFVLQCVPVDVNAAADISQTSISNPLVRLALRVEYTRSEILFDNFSTIDVFENGNFLVNLIEFDFKEFPA